MDYLALDGINLSLRAGQALGIIGENGAGKSTLMQIIAGTLMPNSGEITIDGSVLGILELGVGFHSGFTGRENIFFYGDILGLPRPLLESKLEEIIAFSELGDFIDRPLTTYSSGMQMRLAFSLISSLNPDIWIIDEALAVGDLHFQKKCIDRITEFKRSGKSIVFCSHSTYQISMLCDQVLWLKHGRVALYDEPDAVLPAYEAYQMGKDKAASHAEHPPGPEVPVIIQALELLTPPPLKTGEDLRFRLRIESRSAELPYHVTLSIKLASGVGIHATGTHLTGKPPLRGNTHEILVSYPRIPLLGGLYQAHARIFDDQGLMVYHEKILAPIEVIKETRELGICRLDNAWTSLPSPSLD